MAEKVEGSPPFAFSLTSIQVDPPFSILDRFDLYFQIIQVLNRYWRSLLPAWLHGTPQRKWPKSLTRPIRAVPGRHHPRELEPTHSNKKIPGSGPGRALIVALVV